MDQSGSQMDITITPEALLPIIKKYFERISPAQWSILAQGTLDSDTQATLVDMFVEIIQTLSATILKNVIPMFQEHMHRSASQVDEVKPSSLYSSALPSEPDFFTSRYISITSYLRHMVFHATRYLKRHLGRLNSQCLEMCPIKSCLCPMLHVHSPQSLCPSAGSEISVPSATKAVTDTFSKQSSQTPGIEENAENAVLPFGSSWEAYFIASEIVSDIINDLQSQDRCIEESCSSRFHFNMWLILLKVRDFFVSQVAPSEDTADAKEAVCKRSFFKFAQKQFEKMMQDLKTKFYAIQQYSGPSQLRPEEEEDSDEIIEDILPGSVPYYPKPKRAASAPTSKSAREWMSSLDFETIKNDIDSLFNQLNLPEQPAAQSSNTLEDIMFSGVIRKFSKELTDKIYSHLMSSQTNQIPTVLRERSLFDSAMTRVYVTTEDAVGKFLQQVLLWMEKESSSKERHNEEVCGALTHIQESHEGCTMRTDYRPQATKPSYLNWASSANDVDLSGSLSVDFDCNQLDVRVQVESQHLIKCDVKVTSDALSPEGATSEITQISYPCNYSQPLRSEGRERFKVSIDSSRSTSERATNNLIKALIMRLVAKAPRKTRRSVQTADINDVINRLSDKARDETNLSGSAVKQNKNSITKVNKAVIKDLVREFGSPEKTLEAAMASNNTSFDDAVLNYLKIRLNAPLDSTPISRLFSAVGKAIRKPFMWCITGGGQP